MLKQPPEEPIHSREEFEVAISIEEHGGLERENEPVRVSVPLVRGLAREAATLEMAESTGAGIPHQSQVLARWSDKSIKWLLIDFQASVGSRSAKTVYLRNCKEERTHPQSSLITREDDQSFHVDTGVAQFKIPKNGRSLLSDVCIGSVEHLESPGVTARLTGERGERFDSVVDDIGIEQAGPLRTTLLIHGRFIGGGRYLPATFVSRMTFFVGSGKVEVEYCLRNPEAARHPGNLWDLGDSGSFFFRDLSIEIQPRGRVRGIHWYPELDAETQYEESSDWVLYQDSSGGRNWNSANHVSASGESTVRFSGYQVRTSTESMNNTDGSRATPGITLSTENTCIAACVENFWQNFPKALRRSDNQLSVGLFPKESHLPFELQGGERKRHTIQLHFGVESEPRDLRAGQQPLRVVVDPTWIEKSAVLPYFAPDRDEDNARYRDYIHSIIDGSDSFFAKREIIDEYGWRNFGDTYADHEAVNHDGAEPFISHYNNQYDFLYATCAHFLRTGDARWRQLMTDAAGHLMDIDIYHTDQDRAVYNGGLFWHTDHYQDAGTATHRAYSCRNGTGSDYGGGPSNEQNYTTGLLTYYYMTGDPEARSAVLGLANWVIAMDDGSNSMFAFFDSSDTGRASSTVSADYHGPGRGAGNSINALLDAYAIAGDRTFLQKAESIIVRCVHPDDDIHGLGLDDPEYRWSYLVFFQVLGKYLDTKAEHAEEDYFFFYARDSLLHYAEWILENEVPYMDVLHKVDIPTETWPAQDIRKCHVLHIAAKCTVGKQRELFARKAEFFFDRCLADLLSFDTSYLTRPKVLLAVYGHIHGYFLKNGHGPSDGSSLAGDHDFNFGEPQIFIPQRPLFQKMTWDRWPVLRKFLRAFSAK